MHISISVIISVFNGERYIKRCIRSVLNQTYNVKELIIYDDASTDNTFKIIETCVDESSPYK